MRLFQDTLEMERIEHLLLGLHSSSERKVVVAGFEGVEVYVFVGGAETFDCRVLIIPVNYFFGYVPSAAGHRVDVLKALCHY